jgi:tRNA A-37 threonylcarbamoyl transferase component Bud32
MAFVTVNDRFRPVIAALSLRTAEDFLAIPSVVISGHPDRNVARLMLGPVPAFIKREDRVRLRDRIAAWLAGCGFGSRSEREARTLAALEKAGIGCPGWIAYGQDDGGGAFLIVRALTQAVELRQHLQGMNQTGERRRLARRLGAALARMHEAGFDHPDLYSKHVFVSADGHDFHFLDWQRSRLGRMNNRRRVRDLAALNATMAEELAGSRERLACLTAYITAACGSASAEVSASEKRQARDFRRFLFSAVRRETERLLHKRRICEALNSTHVSQELIRLNGEALCITPQFLGELSGNVPDWLRLEQTAWKKADAITSLVSLPEGREGLLVRRRSTRLLHRLWTEFRRKPLMTPEASLAGVLFRRQRRGESAPRLLAFGQRRTSTWQTESFLLTEPPAPDGGRQQ